MSLLRRLFGGREEREAPRAGDPAPDGPIEADVAAEVEAREREHERELLRAEAERLDALRQRQLRYAAHAWTPPAQGGERRADDGEVDRAE